MSDVILTADEMKRVEQSAFADGIEAEILMDHAGEGIAKVVLEHQPQPGLCITYLGKGNNGGDAMVAGSLLAKAGWEIWTRQLAPESDLQPLPKQKLQELDSRLASDRLSELPNREPVVILDGLLGLGSRPQLSGALKALTREINTLRRCSNAIVYAIDLPTGLGEEGVDPDSVVADFTLTIAFPKTPLFLDNATNCVGRILVIELPELSSRGPKDPARAILSGPGNLKSLVSRRSFDSHKGDYGRVGVLAGSRGFVGASILCAEAAARAGAGLISLYVPEEIYSLVATKVTPEIMVKPITDYRSVLDDRLDALGVGPGLGSTKRQEILDVVTQFAGPMVVDADALNALSTEVTRLKNCAGLRLLTPHPGEMSRLWPISGKSRIQIVREFTEAYPATLLLKGSRTLVGQFGKPAAYNSNGSPGLATGGSGDVLTGVCAGLLARNISPYDAGRLGTWLCGRAAELAANCHSEESMLPSDLFAYFGSAFRELRD